MGQETGDGVQRVSTTQTDTAIDDAGKGTVINEAGHVQELERQFSLLSVCSVGMTTGNMWAALGGSVVRLLLGGRF